jgi:DNA-binding SARP family transcriptional activator/tetratricopeptide (TPR) repeat protein
MRRAAERGALQAGSSSDPEEVDARAREVRRDVFRSEGTIPASHGGHTPVTREQVIAMLRLLTFGGLQVQRDAGSTPELANQRRRLAVLAIVAAAAPAAVTRERLLFLLWPDTDEERGRHALNQIVYNLRRELGESPIEGAGAMRLLPDVMSADVLEFRAAIARGDHAAAAALYTGPFLDGFFVTGAGEFDQWMEEERMRTTRQVISAIEHLSATAATSGASRELATWTARLVELDPLSAHRVLTHMRALAALGDFSSAIAYGRRHTALARASGDDVAPAIDAEIERVRSLPTPSPASAGVTAVANAIVGKTPGTVVDTNAEANADPNADPNQATVGTVTTEAVPTRSRDDAPDANVSVLPAARRAHRWPARAILAGALLIAGIGGIGAWRHDRRDLLPFSAGDRLLLADVHALPDDSASALGIEFALESALQQSSRVQFVTPAAVRDALQRMGLGNAARSLPDSIALEVAEREGVRYVGSLSIARNGASRAVTLRVLAPAGRNTLRSYTETVSAPQLLTAIDAVAARFRRDLGDSDNSIAEALPLPRATTPSLEALRLLAGARAAFNRAMYADARELYTSAIAIDTGFAAAHAGLAAVEYVTNNTIGGDAHIARALALADRLPPRERMLIEAEAARGRGEWGRAATLHRAYLIRYPDDYDSYNSLGYDLFKNGSYLDALEAYDSLRAHRSPGFSALFNIGQANASLGRYAAARTAHVAAIHLDTTYLLRNIQNEQIGANLLRLGFSDSARAVFEVMLSRDRSDQARGHRSLAYVDLYDGRYRSAVQHLRTAIELASSPPGAALSVIRDRALLAGVLLDLRDTTAARDELHAAARACLAGPHDPRALLWTGKPLARLGETARVRLLLDSARARTRDTDREQVSATLTLESEWLVASGKLADGIRAARRAADGGGGAYAVAALANALERAGLLDDARVQYEALAKTQLASVGREAQQPARLAPLAVARIDLLLGRADAARRSLGTFVERWPRADANLPMITALRARIGAVDGATRH